MKFRLLAALLLLSATTAFAQDVDVDKKTGLVTVGGKDAFYLEPKSMGMLNNDYSLQNLEHKELAYLKRVDGTKYNRDGSTSSTINYVMVFTKSGNQCTLNGFSMLGGIIKPMAKMIAGANLVQNGEVSMEEERKFVILHNGTFISERLPAGQQERVVVVNNPDNAPRSTAPADISLKESSIYNNSELVGVFKRSEENGVTVISVYNNTDALVCKASHPTGNDNADWTILSDGRTATILYNPAAPLEKLFKYLVEKSIL